VYIGWCLKGALVDDNKVEEFCLVIGKINVCDEYMIADTGATVHMRKNTEGMFDLPHEQCVIKYGNGNKNQSGNEMNRKISTEIRHEEY
jgi:hypothetical protein